MRDKYNKTDESKKSDSERFHIDFPANLAYARRFCEMAQVKLKSGMRVEVRDSHGLKDALLTISWKPPLDAKKGNYADSIFLHQPRAAVVNQVEQVFDRYIRMINRWELTQRAS